MREKKKELWAQTDIAVAHGADGGCTQSQCSINE